MANRFGVLQQTISIYLQKMPELAKLVNTDLSKGFTVSQMTEKHGCPPSGYCVDTVGLDAEMIRKYVRYQEEKDRYIDQLTLGFK